MYLDALERTAMLAHSNMPIYNLRASAWRSMQHA